MGRCVADPRICEDAVGSYCVSNSYREDVEHTVCTHLVPKCHLVFFFFKGQLSVTFQTPIICFQGPG